MYCNEVYDLLCVMRVYHMVCNEVYDLHCNEV